MNSKPKLKDMMDKYPQEKKDTVSTMPNKKVDPRKVPGSDNPRYKPKRQ